MLNRHGVAKTGKESFPSPGVGAWAAGICRSSDIYNVFDIITILTTRKKFCLRKIPPFPAWNKKWNKGRRQIHFGAVDTRTKRIITVMYSDKDRFKEECQTFSGTTIADPVLSAHRQVGASRKAWSLPVPDLRRCKANHLYTQIVLNVLVNGNYIWHASIGWTIFKDLWQSWSQRWNQAI